MLGQLSFIPKSFVTVTVSLLQKVILSVYSKKSEICFIDNFFTLFFCNQVLQKPKKPKIFWGGVFFGENIMKKTPKESINTAAIRVTWNLVTF